jgi:hypothetical protein
MTDSTDSSNVHSVLYHASRFALSGVATLGMTLVLMVMALVWSGILTP